MSPSQLKKKFIKRITETNRSRHTYQKFDDFLELTYCALAKPVYIQAHEPERADQLEAQYMQVVSRYDDKSTVRDLYPELLGITITALQHPDHDFLGEVASELAVLNSGVGQFFTPYSVSKMMAQMTFTGYEQIIEEKGYITLSEPAVGAGGLVLAFADVMLEQGYNPTYQLLVHATDVDTTAHRMAYIQFYLRGIPALVTLGNTLTLETRTNTWTLPAILFNDYHGHLFDQDQAYQYQPLDDTATITEPDFTLRTNQLSLFGDD